MADDIKSEEIVTTDVTEDKKIETPPAPLQNPIKEELDKIHKKTEGKTELEKAIFTRQQINKRIIELGGEPEIPTDDDNATVTLGMLKKIEKERAVKTALQQAEEISDEAERELVKHHLTNTIKPSGNPMEDLRLARTLANSVKNTQIVEEINRKTKAKVGASGGSQSPKQEEEQPELTQEEIALMRFSPTLTTKDILKARKK